MDSHHLCILSNKLSNIIDWCRLVLTSQCKFVFKIHLAETGLKMSACTNEVGVHTWKVTCDEEGKRGSRWRYPLKIMMSLMSSPLRKKLLTICASVMCNCGWKRSICAIIVQLLLHGAKNGLGGYIGGNKDLQLALNLSFLPIHCLHKFTFNQHLSNELASIVPKNMNTIESRVSRDASPMVVHELS